MLHENESNSTLWVRALYTNQKRVPLFFFFGARKKYMSNEWRKPEKTVPPILALSVVARGARSIIKIAITPM